MTHHQLVADTCRTGACSAEVATALGTVTERLTSSECARESFRNLVGTLDLFAQPGFGVQGGPCYFAYSSGTDDVRNVPAIT